MTAGQRDRAEGGKALFPSFSVKGKLTEHETLDALRMLERFSNNVSIDVSDQPTVRACTGGTEVSADHERYVPGKTLWHIPLGAREDFISAITFKKSWVEKLSEWNQPDSEHSVYDVRMFTFKMAALLLHELARKQTLGRTWPSGCRVFLEHYHAAEMPLWHSRRIMLS